MCYWEDNSLDVSSLDLAVAVSDSSGRFLVVRTLQSHQAVAVPAPIGVGYFSIENGCTGSCMQIPFPNSTPPVPCSPTVSRCLYEPYFRNNTFVGTIDFAFGMLLC